MPKIFPRHPRCSFFSCLLVLILVIVIFSSYFFAKRADIKWREIINLLGQKVKIKIGQRAKEEIKNQEKKLEGKVYKQVTEHNPEGNLLPDEWDDKVKEEMKKRVN